MFLNDKCVGLVWLRGIFYRFHAFRHVLYITLIMPIIFPLEWFYSKSTVFLPQFYSQISKTEHADACVIIFMICAYKYICNTRIMTPIWSYNKYDIKNCTSTLEVLRAPVIFLSFAADIVSGAYPMPSRPSVRQPFFKPNRLLQFSPHLPDILLECEQQYCPKVGEVDFFWF